MDNRLAYRYIILQKLSVYAYGARRYWILLLFLSAAGVAMEFVTPLIYRYFIENVILKSTISDLSIVIIAYLLVYCIGALISYAKINAKCRVVNTVVYRVRRKILNNLWNTPFVDYETLSVGDSKMRIDDDTEQINAFVGSQTIDYLIACITIVVSMVSLISIHWGLTVFSVIAIPFTFWLDHLIANHEKIIVYPCYVNMHNKHVFSEYIYSGAGSQYVNGRTI